MPPAYVTADAGDQLSCTLRCAVRSRDQGYGRRGPNRWPSGSLSGAVAAGPATAVRSAYVLCQQLCCADDATYGVDRAASGAGRAAHWVAAMSRLLAFVLLLMLANHDRWTLRTALLYGGAGALVLVGLYALFKHALQVPLP